MKKIISLILLTFAFGISSAVAGDAPKLLVVKSHADWCGSCKAIEPSFVDLKNKFDGAPLLFVTLDFTNQTTTNQTALLASQLGLDSSLVETRKTGFITVMDTEGKILKKFTKKDSLGDMTTGLKELM